MRFIAMILKHLHHQFGGFNSHIQTACFAEFFGFKNRFTVDTTIPTPTNEHHVVQLAVISYKAVS